MKKLVGFFSADKDSGHEIAKCVPEFRQKVSFFPNGTPRIADFWNVEVASLHFLIIRRKDFFFWSYLEDVVYKRRYGTLENI